MAKRKKRGLFALGPQGPFEINASDLRRFTSELSVVKYVQIDGVNITLNGIEEEALGFGEYIAGSNMKGFYVRSDRTWRSTRLFMKSIDWLRIVRIKTNFDIRAEGYVVVRDTQCWFVTEKRYTLLIKHCSLNYTEEEFEREVQKAIAECKRRGQKPTNVSGQLQEETH